MNTKTSTKFEGKPLIEIPEFITVADFLKGDFGKEALKEYQGRAKSDYQDNQYLNVLNFEDNVVKGSSHFAVVLMNQVLAQECVKVATPADLGKILRTNALDLRGKYEDAALVLRSRDNPNAYLAKTLGDQVPFLSKVQYPVMIPLTSLELVNDSDSNYGLAFKLREDAQIIHAPQLAHKNNHKRFSETDENGLPVFDENGTRTLYTTNSGLSGLGLDRDLDLISNWNHLDNSDSDGRVVIVSGEATGADFKADLTTRLTEQYKSRLASLNAEKAEIEKRIARLGE